MFAPHGGVLRGHWAHNRHYQSAPRFVTHHKLFNSSKRGILKQGENSLPRVLSHFPASCERPSRGLQFIQAFLYAGHVFILWEWACEIFYDACNCRLHSPVKVWSWCLCVFLSFIDLNGYVSYVFSHCRAAYFYHMTACLQMHKQTSLYLSCRHS